MTLRSAIVLLCNLINNFFGDFFKKLKKKTTHSILLLEKYFFYFAETGWVLLCPLEGRCIREKYQMWPSSRHETQRGLKPSWGLTATSFYKYDLLLFPTMVMIVKAWNYAKLSEYLEKKHHYFLNSFYLHNWVIWWSLHLILAVFTKRLILKTKNPELILISLISRRWTK